MEVEKKRSKGNFLFLFDWHGKCRKKLFSNNAELSDGSRQGKENVGIEEAANSQLHMQTETDDRRASLSDKGSSEKGSSDFNCASSLTSDDGTRVPSVVARLMGLDSLPTSNVQEARSAPFPDLCSHYDGRTLDFWSEYQPMDYLGIPNKMDGLPCNPVDSRLNKVRHRPIQRFQSETLPPKSTKSVQIAHHKLLSPIKNPGFVPTKNAAYIMEAAVRIIEPKTSPQATVKSKVSSVGSSSVPLRIRDLKEKLGAANKASRPQIGNDPAAAKHMKGQHSDNNNSASEGTAMRRPSVASGKGNPDSSRKKGKSVSLAEQAKVNVQRREGSTSSSSRSSLTQKEKRNGKGNQVSKSKPDLQSTVQNRTPMSRSSTVLRQNNQKQNCTDNLAKTSCINQQGKPNSVAGSSGANRILNKVIAGPEIGLKKTNSTATHTEKGISSSRRKSSSQNKQLANGKVLDNASISRGGKSIKCNIAIDEDTNKCSNNQKKDMDVVSFTFSSPMIKPTTDPLLSSQGMEKDTSSAIGSFGENEIPYLRSSTSSTHGFSVIGGDALSALLDQKLWELTCKVESSKCNVIREETCASTSQGSVPMINGITTSSSEHDLRHPYGLDNDMPESPDDSDCILIENRGLNLNQKWQVQQSEETEEPSSSSINTDAGNKFDFWHSSPTSILDPSFSSGSCSDNKENIKGSEQFLSIQDQKAFSWLSTNESPLTEDEAELFESISSVSIGTFSLLDSKEPSNWEIEYMKDVLNNAELMLKEFALGQTHKVIPSSLFYQLENTIEINEEDYSKLSQKVLFDCVSECLDLRCKRLFTGSCKEWAMCAMLFGKKEKLAEELYKEILGWKSMGDLMLDELVDKDMSSQHGRWLDFDEEASEEGIEIEKGILTSLLDELVFDLLPF